MTDKKIDMQDDIVATCPFCGGDRIAGEIARILGYRPDVAFAKLRNAEDELSAWRDKFPDYRYENVVDGVIKN